MKSSQALQTIYDLATTHIPLCGTGLSAMQRVKALIAEVKHAEDHPEHAIQMAFDTLHEHQQPYVSAAEGVYGFLELCTSHVTQKTAALMGSHPTGPNDELGFIYHEHGEYGWWVYVDAEEGATQQEFMPADLYAIVKYASELKCRWVLLDRDADPRERFPVYEW